MKLRSITLTNVRRFAGQTATISGIGDGISVIAAPNEFGKSTFFDALHALFFNSYSGAPKEVKSLQPDPAGGAVGIMAEVELPGGSYRIEKRFLGKRMARVTDLTCGAIIAQDDAAEDWIRRLTDHGLNGPAGLLWVRQGATSFETGSNAENVKSLAERRNLLSSVAGEIDLMTGGRRMDRVRDRCLQELDRIATARTRAPSGEWKAAKEEIAALTLTIDDLSRKCAFLSDALIRRREIERRLASLEDATARSAQQAALTAAEAALAEAKAHADKVSAAAQAAKIALLQQQGHANQLADLVRAISVAATAGQAAQKASLAEADLAARVGEAEQAEAALATTLTDRTAEVRNLRDRATAVRQAQARVAATVRAKELAARLIDAERHRAAAEQADAAMAANSATPERVAALDRAIAALSQARAAAKAQAATLTLTYDGTARVRAAGQAMPPGVTALTGRITLELPGIGQMIVDPGAAVRQAGGDTLFKAEKAAATALAACGTATVEAAHQAARDRQEAETAARLAKVMLASLAPEGLHILRTALAAAVEQAGEATASPQDAANLPDLDAALSAAEDAESQARLRREAASKALSALQSDHAAAKVSVSTAMNAQQDAEAAAGDPATRTERQAQAGRTAAQAGADLAAAEETLAGLTANAPDIATAQAEHARAKSVVTQTDREIKALREERAGLVATISTQAEEAPEERLAEAQGAREAAMEREARFAGEVAALSRLLEVLEEERRGARDTYFKPVQQELQPLLAILADDAALTFDPASLLPGQLARQGLAEPVDRLSGGTQEQIAILTRLAFARLFAKAGSPVPVILDDALVHTDDDRIVRMFTALHRVAADQQVIVFTCRQMAFQALGGDRPEIRIADS